MERFAFKIDKTLKANLYKICRLCGIDNPEKVNILSDTGSSNANADDGEPELWRKIKACVGFTICKDDKMPQTMCSLCVDKINDFFEFREMCFATNLQTRKLLGLKEEPELEPPDIKEVMPSPFIKRAICTKGKRKRKSEDLFTRSTFKTDVDDVKMENVASSAIGTPIRKKSKFSTPHLAGSTHTITYIGTTTAATTLLQKKSKPMLPLQKRTVEQSDRNIKPKDEIKDEVIDISGDDYLDFNSATMAAKVNKFKQFCNICEQRFINKAQLDRHQSAVHVPNIPRYFCVACNEAIKKNNDIKNHQLWHKLSKTPFVCALCDDKLMNTYAYSRHLREHNSDISERCAALIVLDRQCPQCQETFVTNYLYNIHPCSIRTKKCAGCNRMLKTEHEYRRHAAICPKVFINYSKHIAVTEEGEEACIRIKNENDVEAAVAAESFPGLSGPDTSFDMSPVVSLAHLATPLLMESNQCVLIPGHQVVACGDSSLTPTTSNVKLPKKANKKSVSIKEFKRVDELLKSTMDTLVSIKHEPEMHMDTCDVMPEVAESGSLMNENVATADDDMETTSTLPPDDFQGFNSSDDGINEESEVTSIRIKQEPLDDAEKTEENISSLSVNVNSIKQEVVSSADPNKMPVLKLKITKEHGKLNSSLVQEDDLLRSEKKKKKKKRKDSDKEKDKPNDENLSETSSLLMPQPGMIQIKPERFDHDDEYDNAAASMSPQTSSHRNNDHLTMPESLVMTTIPQALDFQIACISSGVDFKKEDTEPEAATVSQGHANDDFQDIKPCRETLDHLMQISHVSGGVGITSHSGNSIESEEQRLAFAQHQPQHHHHPHRPTDESPERSRLTEINANSQSLQFVGGDVPDKHSTTENINEVSLSLPQIIAVSSCSDVTNELPAIPSQEAFVVKKERFDADYGDVVPSQEAANEESSMMANESYLANLQQEHEQQQLNETAACYSAGYTNAEQAYIAKIDFNNLRIKQEKEIEVSEVQISELSASNSGIIMHNGLKTPPQKTRRKKDGSTDNDKDEDEPEEEDDEGEEEEEEGEDDDNDDEAENNEINEEFEEREYRELEIPPLLADETKQGEDNAEDCKQSCPVQSNSESQSLPLTIPSIPAVAELNNAASNTSELPEEHLPTTTDEYQTPCLKISSVLSEFKAANEAKTLTPTPADNDDALATEIGTLCGSIEQHADTKLTAVPFYIPPTVTTTTPLNNDSPETPLENDFESELDEETNDNEQLDSGEELQNQLNNDLTIAHHHPLGVDAVHSMHNPSMLRNLLTMPPTQAVASEEALALGFDGSSSSNETSTMSSQLTTTTTNTTIAAITTNATRPCEETENLMNERNDRPVSGLLPLPRIPSNNTLLINDDCNINEIAENNNNANIERELQDDNLNATAANDDPAPAAEVSEEAEVARSSQADIT